MRRMEGLFLAKWISIYVGGVPELREHHLHRYLAEFDFRYSNRVALALMAPFGRSWRLWASKASS